MIRTDRFPNVGSIGYGCLQLESIPNEDTAVRLIVEAYRLGVRFFDTAAAYGPDRHNEKLLGRALVEIKRTFGETSEIFFATKCGINFSTLNTPSEGYEGSPEEIRASVEKSLTTLKVSQIPLLYLHRINPKSTPEEMRASFEALKNLCEQKKVRFVGLSEVTREQILMADEVFQTSRLDYNPLAFVQSACSIGTQRAFRNGVFQTCREKGMLFVSYRAVLRGMVDPRLSQHFDILQVDQLEAKEVLERIQRGLNIPVTDFRFQFGFLSPTVIKTNLKCILLFQKMARDMGVESSQLALSWQKAKGLLPIPGTTNLEHLRSNVGAMKISLTPEQIEQIDTCFKPFKGNPNTDGRFDNVDLEKTTC